VSIDLRDRIRDVPDFPSEGIVFKDLMPLIADPQYFAETIHQLADWARPREPALIFGAEARSQSSASSISSSCPRTPTVRRRARSAVAPGPSSSSRMTRSGKNSSRWSRRIVVRRSMSSGAKSRYPPRVRRGEMSPWSSR